MDTIENEKLVELLKKITERVEVLPKAQAEKQIDRFLVWCETELKSGSALRVSGSDYRKTVQYLKSLKG